MIARVWRGATRAGDADEYAAYLERTGMESARALPGNRGTLVLRHVRGFAGDDYETAVFHPEDDQYLVDRDLVVRHFDVDVHVGS